MSYNKIILIANLGGDPVLRYTPQGTAVCNFSVATTEKSKGQGGEQQEKTTWFRVTVWGNRAESCSKYLAKGRPVYLEGRLKQDEYTDKDGNKRQTLEVNASEVIFMGNGGNKEDNQHHDQRRRGPDESEQSQALDLKDDDIPF